MRKFYALLLFGLFDMAIAQVPNADFEMALGYGQTGVANWGQAFIITVTIDPNNGETHFDQIIYEPEALGGFCTSVAEAHSGERALCIRNAFNATQNVVIAGEANLFNSEISELPTGWNFGVPVAADADINSLGFWYKFHPIGNDVAEAILDLFDENGENIGTAKIQISEEAEIYTYIAVPVTFTSVADPAFMTISFAMQAEGSTAVFGSSLLIDNVTVDNVFLQNSTFDNTAFMLFPTVAETEINFRGISGNYDIAIYNMQGRRIIQTNLKLQNGISESIDVSKLARGIYFLNAENNGARTNKKFIKK